MTKIVLSTLLHRTPMAEKEERNNYKSRKERKRKYKGNDKEGGYRRCAEVMTYKRATPAHRSAPIHSKSLT